MGINYQPQLVSQANTLIFDTAIMTAAGRGNAWNVALQLGGKRWVTWLNGWDIQRASKPG